MKIRSNDANSFSSSLKTCILAEPKELPYTLLEVRFTPADRTKALVGAGQGGRRCWIDLICNDTHGFEKYYEAADQIIHEIKARPHLGKFGTVFYKKLSGGIIRRKFRQVSAVDARARSGR